MQHCIRRKTCFLEHVPVSTDYIQFEHRASKMFLPFILLTLSLMQLVASVTINIDKNMQDFIVNLHNQYRGGVSPPAANMQEMKWDAGLAKKAAYWVGFCNFKHQMKGPGENLAYDTHKLNNKALIRGAMQRFMDERDDYVFGTAACSSYRACHYTQIVWATTTRVGCSMKMCPSLNVFGRGVRDAWYFACFYEPMGNTIGQTPYEKGTPCSKCLDGQTCSQNICRGKGQLPCVDKNKSCRIWQEMNECNKNPKYMSVNCRKSCGICEGSDSDGGTSEENDTTDSATEIGNTCEDSDSRCQYWARIGECTKNPWMLTNCKKACRKCDNAPDTSCSDNFGCCRDMKSMGYCRKYGKFMRENCKKSCSRC